MIKPMHIGLLLQGGRGWLGGFEYVKGILSALGAVSKEDRARIRVTLITPDRQGELEQTQMGCLIDQALCLSDEMPTLSSKRRLVQRLGKHFLGVEFSPLQTFLQRQNFDFVYPYTPENEKVHSFAHASWIFDFQHKYLPEFFSKEELLWRDRFFEHCARRSPLVVVSSRNAERDFRRFFPFAAQKSRVFSFRTPQKDWWYTADPNEVQREYCLPDRFFLVANQFWKHKNHMLVFKAIKTLVAQGVTPTVVFTGNLMDNRSPEHADAVLQTIQQLGIHPQVHLLGIVPKNHYVQLLRRCIAVIQPSLFEGWSTIVEDCRSLGKRMLLSDLEVHREQDLPGATFFRSTSEADLAMHMRMAWESFPPGPDHLMEAQAKLVNVEGMQVLGKQFLEIVFDAVRLAGTASKRKA